MSNQPEEDVIGKVYDSRLMGRLLRYLRPYKWQAGVSFVAILLKAACDVMGPFLFKVAIDNYLTAKRPEHPNWLARQLSPHPAAGITELAALYLAALLLTYLFEFVQTYLIQWMGQKVMFDLRSQIFRHIQGMHVGFFDRNPVGRLVTRLTSDVDALNEMFTSGVFAIFDDIFVLAGIVIIMLQMNWKLALLAFAVLPLIGVVTAIFRKYVRSSYRRIRSAIAKINAFTQEHISGMTVVQLFNREKRAFHDFEVVNRQHMVAFKDAILAYALYYPAVEILSTIAIALVLWRGGDGVLKGTVTVGVLVAFMQYSMRFFRPIQDLSDKYNILQAAMAASERVFQLLDTPTEIVNPTGSRAVPQSGRIEFRNVWFTYQRLDEDQKRRAASANPEELAQLGASIEWILRDVSFVIEPGQTAAIVGHTGAGKTTIVSLMMRFYDIQSGSILVDGVDVRLHDLKQLRQRFGVVLQDPFLFTGTIADNIRLGSSWITEEHMKQASRDVNLLDYIEGLPGGFDEAVRERGATLSTGRKQLINFARALAHDPKILILDEATSSVDTDTELLVRSALERMVTGRTSVVIAHRLSTVQRADVILVMHKGQLREMGTHQELLARRGLYYKLYQLQYKDQELPRFGFEPTATLVGSD
ncbi:ABC transporter ATP-binding protein [Acidisarcina polymorpha]|uniref:Multidrug resistance-like ATP-binding protein MdlA n=1 Tax=Acidisarcina polymorpha TaxID=2211140 RepID=A0A2Z5G7N6_9BACT|nr:ABC transporter ATP-binding protein [Acidisarcina polymorpha]AXC14990.1 ABC transporter ATP-binding protein [Acidisarcina polymorpha]